MQKRVLSSSNDRICPTALFIKILTFSGTGTLLGRGFVKWNGLTAERERSQTHSGLIHHNLACEMNTSIIAK